MKSRYAAILAAWILWRVGAFAGAERVEQIWLPEQSFASFEACQRAEYNYRKNQPAPSNPPKAIVKFICMPDTFIPPQQEPTH